MRSRFVTWVIIIVGLILIVSTIKDTIGLWKAGDRVDEKAVEVKNLEKENEKIQEKISQIESPAYIEKYARDRLNLAKPGESVVILPKDNISSISAETLDNRSNWEKWWDLFKN